MNYEVRFDFNRAAPADEIYADLRRLARRTCAVESSGELEFARASAEKACRDDFVGRAVAAINMPSLLAYHADRKGQSAMSVALAER